MSHKRILSSSDSDFKSTNCINTRVYHIAAAALKTSNEDMSIDDKKNKMHVVVRTRYREKERMNLDLKLESC